MTGKQTAVLWMGILLIAAQFYFGGQIRTLLGLTKKSGPVNSPSKKAPAYNPGARLGGVAGRY